MVSAFIDLLRHRRSIRAFTPAPVEQTMIAALQEAALRAPTSRGINPWHFIFIDDADLIQQVARAKAHGSQFLARAPLAIVVCADESASDVWIEDGSIAAITLHYAATDLGLGSCWVQIRNRPHDTERTAEHFMQELLHLPPQIRVEAVMGIGHPAESKTGHSQEELLRARLHCNRFGK